MDRFFLDEVANLISEILKEGYHYGTISVLKDPETGKEYISIEADDDGGNTGLDYDAVDSVDLEEVENYAFRNKKPPKHRKIYKV